MLGASHVHQISVHMCQPRRRAPHAALSLFGAHADAGEVQSGEGVVPRSARRVLPERSCTLTDARARRRRHRRLKGWEIMQTKGAPGALD